MGLLIDFILRHISEKTIVKIYFLDANTLQIISIVLYNLVQYLI